MNTYNFRTILFLSLLLTLAAEVAFGQSAEFSIEARLKEDVALAPCNSADRLPEVKKLFLKMGAPESAISSGKFSGGENFFVKIKGQSVETIVVGAHYDKAAPGCGAIDNWTGVVILANLYKSISQSPTNKSYLFVAFDQEEAGLLGSKAMVKSIPKENLAQYCSMVNIDSFGFALPQSPSNMSNVKMVDLAKETAKEMNIKYSAAAINDADADSLSFLAKKIPAITFDGLSHNWERILHSDRDQVSRINIESVGLGYQFVLTYLKKVDNAKCRQFK